MHKTFHSAVRFFIFSVLLIVAGSTSATAQVSVPEGTVFKRATKKRDLVLKNCSLISGKSKAIISKGRTVSVGFDKEDYTLPNKYSYFACANDGTRDEDTLYARTSSDGEITSFQFSNSDFPKAENKLAKVCKNVSPLSRALLKNAYPGHIGLSDPRASGFAFVCGSDCPRSFPVSAYYSDGTLAFRLGYYGVWSGNGRPRAYCAAGGVPACSASGVTSAARQKNRDGKVYLDFGGKSCRSATPGARNGSTS